MPLQEPDSLIAAARRGPATQKDERDGLIMDTNKSSIVSKRSVEKLYLTGKGQPEYFRHFVSKFKRRSPLINRGYWLRMKAIEYAVVEFLTDRKVGVEGKGRGTRKVVVNLGCGYDPLPFMFLGDRPEICENTIFVDVDYPDLMRNKLRVVEMTAQIRGLLGDFRSTGGETGLLGSSDNYAIVACDLIDTGPLKRVLRDRLGVEEPEVSILFLSEVSTAYMEREASQAVFAWTATYPNARFALLEQHIPDGPDHPFAVTMMAHFEKLRTPLRALGTMEQMKQRFISAGYSDRWTSIRSLWELWSDPTFLSDEERRALDDVEPFDEWEEYALYASHYFLLIADNQIGTSLRESESSGSSTRTSVSVSQGSTDTDRLQNGTPQSEPTSNRILQAHELRGPRDHRRFAAIVPPPENDEPRSYLGLHGGMGTRERESGCITYNCTDDTTKLSSPPLRSGIMCHTITRLGTTSDCLLVGGRASPEKVSAQCWVRLGNVWQPTYPLPSGRHRHAATPIVLPGTTQPNHTVLIFGGKANNGQTLDEWLLWDKAEGWKQVEVIGDSPSARFGASIITDGVEGLSGVLVGGMTNAGLVLNDFWHWELTPDLKMNFRDMTSKASSLLKGDASILGRFAAQLVRAKQGILMIGGISGQRMLTRQDEILNMKTLRPEPLQGSRALFVGCSIQDVDEGLLVLGGGATCFSFGTTWNSSYIINEKPESTGSRWNLVVAKSISKTDAEPNGVHPQEANGVRERGMPKPVEIQRIPISQEVNFERYVQARKPVVLTDCDLGPCKLTWETKYLKDAIGAERMVSVHVATSQKMDFQVKNFTYETQEFGRFLDAIDDGEKLYLRSLSKGAPSEKATSLEADFPEIASDFKLPPELSLIQQNIHSSPLRISGPVQMWLHYDVMANVLCQIRGSKRVLLFPPSDVTHLGFEAGASSSSLDVFDKSAGSDTRLANTHPVETVLRPGDVLLIPPMWMHSTAPTEGSSIGVNVFFRNLDKGYAAGRDVYGNRDLAAYEKGRKDMTKLIHSFGELPSDVSGFYLERLAMELLEKARTLSRNDNPVNIG